MPNNRFWGHGALWCPGTPPKFKISPLARGPSPQIQKVPFLRGGRKADRFFRLWGHAQQPILGTRSSLVPRDAPEIQNFPASAGPLPSDTKGTIFKGRPKS